MRIAVATTGTSGDVRPFVPLATALASRGHEVTAISAETNREAFEAHAIRFEAAGPQVDESDVLATAAAAAAASPLRQVELLRDFHLRDAADHYRTLRELFPRHELVLLHGIHSLAEAAARDADIPWATAVFDPVLLPTATAPPPGLPSLGPLNRLAWRMLDRALEPAGRPLRAVLTELGSRHPKVKLFRARSPRLHLVAASPRLIRVPPDLPPTWHVTGAWTATEPPEPLPADLESFIDDGPPPVVLTLGSMSRGGTAADAIAAAVRAAGHRLVVQLEIPADDPEIHRARTVDHRSLFPRASLVVHHGGAGTTHAVVAAGLPSIVVPHLGDQRFWAERLHAVGVAPKPLPVRDVTIERLSARLAAVDDTMRARARALGPELRGERGLERAVELVERALG